MKNLFRVRRPLPSRSRLSLETLETRLTPATFMVSNLNDADEGSFRQAILDANSTTGADVIDFSVAGTIQLTSAALPAISDPVTIDGTSAPGFSNAPVVELDANGFAGLVLGPGLLNSSLASLSIVNANGPGLTVSGSDITVVGNYLGLALDGSTKAGNSGAGLLLTGATHDTIGGTSLVDRNVISGNGGDGIDFSDISSFDTVIGNRIGTDATGQTSVANTGFGIAMSGEVERSNFIGGMVAADQNLISGNMAGGIQLGTPGSELDVQQTEVDGNFIGTNASGTLLLPNQGNGITINSADNTIGAGRGNVIAFNTQSGVVVHEGSQNSILGNSIFSNGSQQGIVLELGANNNQPAPVLMSASVHAGSTPSSFVAQVGGTLTALDNAVYTIQVFANGFVTPGGQGQLFIGSVTTTTNASGQGSFVLSDAAVPTGSGLTFTATATSVSFNTSMFSTPIGADDADLNYVANVYQLLLNRAPDEEGLQFWAGAMHNGTPAQSVVEGIAVLGEYLNDQVISLYTHYLGRSPDPAGQSFWSSFLLNGGTLEQVAEGLASSDEYFTLEGSTNQGFVQGLYTQVLNRSPGNAELNSWLTALNAGASRSSVAVDFLSSTEYRTDLVQNDYKLYLSRSADAGGLEAWLAAFNAGSTDQQVLAGILGSPEGFGIWSKM